MSNDLAIFESTLRPLTPHFEQALGRAMPVERLMRTIMISVERNPKLLTKSDRQSLLNSAMSAACLGLEVDGVSGQAFLVPFGGKAQLIVGYKGYNTLGARSGLTIQGQVVREGDDFKYKLGTGAFIDHVPLLNNRGAVIAAWATASSNSRPDVVEVMGVEELMEVRAKSPAVKNGADTPWNEMKVGFPAMCSKTVKRRLSRSTPLNADPRFHQAATMEENFEERGKMSWIDPNRGVMIDGEIIGDAPQINHDQRSTQELLVPRGSATPSQGRPQPGDGVADELADDLMSWDSKLATASHMGPDALKAEWARVPKGLQSALKPGLDQVHKLTAAKVSA